MSWIRQLFCWNERRSRSSRWWWSWLMIQVLSDAAWAGRPWQARCHGDRAVTTVTAWRHRPESPWRCLAAVAVAPTGSLARRRLGLEGARAQTTVESDRDSEGICTNLYVTDSALTGSNCHCRALTVIAAALCNSKPISSGIFALTIQIVRYFSDPRSDSSSGHYLDNNSESLRLSVN